VALVSPLKKTIQWHVDQPATILPYEVTPLVAKLPGYVRKIHVEIGDEVKAGQLLAELEIPELQLEAAQKVALVKAAEAEQTQTERALDVAKAKVAAADAHVVEAKAMGARTQADLDRWTSALTQANKMYAEKVVDSQTLLETRKQYDAAMAAKEEVKARVMSAEASVKEAQAMQGRAEAEVMAAGARLTVAKAEADRVAALVSYATIKAPFQGVVTNRNVHPGHFLQPVAGARPDALFTVARLDKVRVQLDVPESIAAITTVGTKAVLRVPGLSNREVAATVTRTAKVVNPDNRTLKVELGLPNRDQSLLPGMYATVRVSATTVDAMVLPTSAVLFADETAYCFVVKDGKAIKVRVRVGRMDGNTYEVHGYKHATATDWTSFTPEDKVANGNLGALLDGQAVTVKP
jgi:multidrug efflux pump subunit AcrA (membrane-fusion protein)